MADEFKAILIQNPETKSLTYAESPTDLGNYMAMGWTVYEGSKTEFKTGKDVPWGSNTETVSALPEGLEAGDPQIMEQIADVTATTTDAKPAETKTITSK